MELVAVLVVVGVVVVMVMAVVARRGRRQPLPTDQPTVIQPDASAGDPHRADGTVVPGSGPDRAARGKP